MTGVPREGDPIHVGGVVDLRTGQVWPQSSIDYVRGRGDDTDAPDSADPVLEDPEFEDPE